MQTLPPLPPPWNLLFSLFTRGFVWGLFFAALYMLSSFFLLLFLTFVFSYIIANGANRLAPFILSRTRRVILFSSLFLSVLIAGSLYMTPRVIEQTENFAGQFDTYMQRIDVEIIDMAQQSRWLRELLDKMQAPGQQPSPSTFIIKQLVGVEGDAQETDLQQMLAGMKNIGARVLSVVSAFLLALLFSFLIVLDLPKLSNSVRGLRHTRVGFIYEEVADSIYHFAKVLGQAFEAQFLIALVNTVLTVIGLYFLGMGKHTAFLSMLVFLFSFVPVAGVFISSVPICLIALQAQGFSTLLAAIGLITGIHLLEGYVLNPRIYGARMRINPVIVLIILTIGGKLFHFWGLILGVPVCTYIFGHAIRLPREHSDPACRQ